MFYGHANKAQVLKPCWNIHHKKKMITLHVSQKIELFQNFEKPEFIAGLVCSLRRCCSSNLV